MILYFFITILILIAYLFYKEYEHNKIVKDLTLKIMSRNLGEYAVYAGPPREKEKVVYPVDNMPLINLEDADENELNKAMIKELEEARAQTKPGRTSNKS